MDVLQDLRFDEVLADHRQRWPDHLAVVDSGLHLSYRELAERVNALAAALRASGFAAGDRLLWAGDGSARLVESLLAVARLGGVCCPVSARQPEDMLAAILDDCTPAVVVSDGPRPPVAARLRDSWWIPADGVGGYEDVVRAHRRSPPVAETGVPDAPLLLLYAAVPGRPVGLQVSRNAVLHEVSDAALRANTGGSARRPVHGPMHSIAAVVAALAAILSGTTLVLPASPVSHETLLEL